MNSYLRVSILGFIAGLLALLTLIAVVYLALATATLAFTLVNELAQAQASGTMAAGQFWRLLGQSLVASGGNAVRGLWALWGAFLVFGLLGLLAAWSYQVGRVLAPARAWWISFLAVAAFVSIAIITWIYVQGEQIALWMAESPETYRWRGLLVDSHRAALTVSPLLAFAFTYPAWALWRWWYLRLAGPRFVHNGALHSPLATAHNPTTDYRSYTTRMAALKRGVAPSAVGAPEVVIARPLTPDVTPLAGLVNNNGLLALLALLAVGCFTGYLVTAHYHRQVALRLQHGVAFVDATTQPLAEFPVQIAADVQRLRIVNINGLGAVSLVLSPAANPTQVVDALPDWAFQWRADDYLYQEIPVQKLTPGDYIVRFEQRAGWGYFEYMLSQGGGRASQTLAVATGLLLATALVLAGAAALLVVVRLSSRTMA